MTPDDHPAWNDEARIRFQFQFICPQRWRKLEPTMENDVRFCLECRRDVHLARTEGDLRRLGEQGFCVAVPLVRGKNESPDEPRMILGMVDPPYKVD